MSKVYDSINHDLLIYKLQKYGIHGNLLKLIKSFLKNRTQSVKIGNCISEEFTASSGIGQGTYMGSLSYVAYTNDCKDAIKHSKVLIYADDTKIYKLRGGTVEKFIEKDGEKQ